LSITGHETSAATSELTPGTSDIALALARSASSLETSDFALEPSTALSLRDRWPWIELFLAVQFLWGGLLFIPGSQAYRAVIRALPYASSLGLLAMYMTAHSKARYPWGTRFVLAVLGLLALNLLHPTSQPLAGIAQCIFQLSIVAPIFWASKGVRSPARLQRILVLTLLMNAASAGLGLLQVYYPDQFMPPQFSTLGLQQNDAYVDSQTYQGRDGRIIVRPPGLTDMPGGAAVAGGFTAVLGLALSLRSRKASNLLLTLALAAVGLAVIYLTEVRSVLLNVVGGAAALAAVAIRQRRIGAAAWIAGTGVALVVVAFLWASSIGGDAIEQRFMSIREQGALQTYQENRGHFLAYTVGELLDQFPFGAGVGRWGMMNAYFGDPTDPRSPPIYVEIQLTGWLLDGGALMWVLYGGAILLAGLGVLGLTGALDPRVSTAAFAVLAVQVLIVGMGMAGPVFNTQLGMMFWVLVGSLHGAVSLQPAAEGVSETSSS
jgi:hypothetical protein